MKKFYKLTIISVIIITILLLSSGSAVAKRLNLPPELVSAIRNFLSGDTQITACDYKDGMIILVKPVATGTGEGRYEAGDIVSVRDMGKICAESGNIEVLGSDEKTKLLPLYYPHKLTEEQIKELTEPDDETIEHKIPDELSPTGYTIQYEPKVNKRRNYGVDYIKLLNASEVEKATNLESIDRLPEIEFIDIEQKVSDVKAVSMVPDFVGKKKSNWQKFVDIMRPTAYADTVEVIKTIKSSGGNYASLATFEAGEQRNLVTADEIAVAEVYNNQNISYLDFNGWTTDIDRRIVVRPPTINGEYDPDYYHYMQEGNGIKIDVTGGTYGWLIRADHYLTVSGLELCGSNNGATSPIFVGITADSVRLIDDLIHNILVTGVITSALEYAKNIVFYDGDAVPSSGYGTVFYTGKLINVSIYADDDTGGYAGQLILRECECYNVAVYNTTVGGISDFYLCTGDYNASSDASSPGAHSLDNLSLSDFDFVSTTEGSENLHLASDTGELIGAGVGNSVNADVLAYDIDLEEGGRAGATCDVGADEYVASGQQEQPITATSSAIKLKGGIKIKGGVKLR